MKCSRCPNTIHLESSDDEPHRINGKPVCRDCWFEALGECIEKHPIGMPFELIEKLREEGKYP